MFNKRRSAPGFPGGDSRKFNRSNRCNREETSEDQDVANLQEDEEEIIDMEDDDNGNSDSDEQDEEVQRTSIRKELSNLTFEELEALKAKLGTKVYNEAMFGAKSGNSKNVSSKRGKAEQVFKRENHNRPREMSSKVRVPKVREVVPVKKKRHRDPRFENLCGELDEKLWKNNYSFLEEMREKEDASLKEKLKNEELEEEQALQAKEYLKRVENKKRSDAQMKKIEDKRKAEKEENKQRMKEGKRPYFMKKSTKKYTELAEKYDELKASGKLEGYLKKKRARNAARDKKSMKF